MAKPIWIVRWSGKSVSGSATTAMALAKLGNVGSVRTQDAVFDFYCQADDEAGATSASQTYAAANGITLVGAPISVVQQAPT